MVNKLLWADSRKQIIFSAHQRISLFLYFTDFCQST